jgi:hypothetical protein
VTAPITAGADVAFEASARFPFFDYFRVPYRVGTLPPTGRARRARSALGELRPAGGPAGSRLYWVRSVPRRATRAGLFELAGFPIAGHVVPDDVVRRELLPDPTGWRRAEPVRDPAGRPVASVWRDAAGGVLLPFDPGELVTTLWSERYRELVTRPGAAVVRRLALRAYYLVRPALPRPVQLRLRRAFTGVQARATFPRWPVEDALHDLYGWLFAELGRLAGAPVPWLDLWPDGRSWSLVLTHDVETAAGWQLRRLLRDPERELGLRSSWNLVAERYQVDDAMLRELRQDGCEIGVHGLRHDGRDLGSRRLLRQRLPAMRAAARRWDAVGFRSPATHRRWEWMPRLGFDYDTSSPDTDPYEPQPGGCCSVLPFHNADMVELPITLPQDHTLFALLDQPDGALWLQKLAHIRAMGGMALVLTHPDYADDPRVPAAYRSLLAEAAADPEVWPALPREVADWWRRRAVSDLRPDGTGGWMVVGPAAGSGRVRLGGTSPAAPGPPAAVAGQ